jgi:protein phosphatase
MPLDSLMTLKFDNSEIIPAKIELEKEIVDTIPEAEEKTEESPKVEPKLPEKSKSVESKRSERKEKELEEKEEESPCKSFDFRLSSECHVAMSYSSDMPPNFSRMVRTLAIDKLQEESKKMGGSKPKTHSKRKHKASQSEHICNMFINQLLKPHEWSTTCLERRFLFKSQYIIELADQCTKILQDQPTVLRCKPPIKVFGDIHGQFQDLMRFFDLWRAPTDIGHGGDIESYDYLFLGDFVDRGSASLETVCLLMALKVKFPNSIHLIRGNHEDKWINNVFGFAEECSERLGEDVDDPRSVFNAINNMFEWLPLAAIIQDEIICLHGGIGASLDTVKDIEELVRPLEVIHEVSNSVEQKLVDILWSDPTDNDEEHGIQPNTIRDPNGTGNIVRFGPDRVQQFLQQNGLGMIIRAHECVMDGFERFADGKLITVFSATDYCGRHKNAGAVLVIQKNLEIIPKLIFPLDLTSHNTWIENEKRPPTPPRWKRD